MSRAASVYNDGTPTASDPLLASPSDSISAHASDEFLGTLRSDSASDTRYRACCSNLE